MDPSQYLVKACYPACIEDFGISGIIINVNQSELIRL